MTEIPSWIQQAREHWTFRGQRRPEFAEPIGKGQESVWDYPRPPRLEADAREVVVMCGGTEIARTSRAWRVLETASPPTFYLPPSDVRIDLLQASPRGSFCEWKGQAHYWTIHVPGMTPLRDATWSYQQPFAGFGQIAGYLSFYPGRLECFVDGNRAQPQPGGLYGGWVTPEIVGPFKGEPGTQGW